MNIKQLILICALINAFNLNAMLHKLTGNITKQHSKGPVQKILKRMQHQLIEERLNSILSNKALKTTLAIPAGMVGVASGAFWGYPIGALLALAPAAILNDEDIITKGAECGSAMGAVCSGIAVSCAVGSIPGVTALSLTYFALYAKSQFDKQNNKLLK